MSVQASGHTVGDSVYQELLRAIYDGRLQPGQRVNDLALAKELGISRTPVREAIQRLRTIGVIEAEANRFTRIAVVGPDQVREHLIVWVALMHAVVDEVLPALPASVPTQMETQHQQFTRMLDVLATLGMGDEHLAERIERSRDLATTNFAFFAALVEASANRPLRAALERAQHVVHLGSLSLPEWVDVSELARAQARLITALKDSDASTVHAVLDALRDFVVPGAHGTAVTV